MNFQDDPAVQQAMAEHRIRRGLWINALLWMPLFLLTAGALVYFTADVVLGLDRGGTVFLLVVLTILSVLFGFQGFQAVLDLKGKQAHIEGFVTRRWARSDSIIMRTHYVRLGRKHIFRIDRVLHGDVKEGDYVELRYYPHSAIVLEMQKRPAPEGADPAEVIVRKRDQVRGGD